MYLKRMGVKKVYAITAGDNVKREELAIKLGADKVFNLTREGTAAVTKALQAENGGLGVDLCFEASGAPRIPTCIPLLKSLAQNIKWRRSTRRLLMQRAKII